MNTSFFSSLSYLHSLIRNFFVSAYKAIYEETDHDINDEQMEEYRMISGFNRKVHSSLKSPNFVE